MGNHRFVTNGQGYYTRTICEWCGLVAFYSNDPEEERQAKQDYLKAHPDCPNTPTYVTVQPTPKENNEVDNG